MPQSKYMKFAPFNCYLNGIVLVSTMPIPCDKFLVLRIRERRAIREEGGYGILEWRRNFQPLAKRDQFLGRTDSTPGLEHRGKHRNEYPLRQLVGQPFYCKGRGQVFKP